MSEPVTLEDVQRIIELIRDAENVAEFSLKYGDLEISLSRNAGADRADASPGTASPAKVPEAPSGPPTPAEATPKTAGNPAGAASAKAEPAEGEIAIKAPMVGTFYRAPKPGEPPFVEVGSRVSKDTVLCIIEVMKLMNSLQAGVEGTVTRILIEDAKPVEYGQALIFVRPGAS